MQAGAEEKNHSFIIIQKSFHVFTTYVYNVCVFLKSFTFVYVF